MEINRVAVIGSNSFTGAHFVNHVLEKTNAEVIGISRSPEYNKIFLPYLYKKERSKRFKFYQLDVNKNIEEIKKILDKFEPEIVANYSAQGEVRNSWKWPEQWFKTNCIGIVNIANHLKDRGYLKRYINVSTPEVYGSTEKNIKENYNFYPSTPYAASKLAGELFLFSLFKKYRFPFVSTRSANVYGVHQQLYRIIPRTIIYLKMGKKIQLHGDGKAVRSFINIRDISDATLKAIEKGKNGEAYHLAPERENISIRDLIDMICNIMGYDFEKSVEMIKENFGQDDMYSLNIDKAKKELDWKPTIDLKSGIKEVIDWINESWEELKKQPLEYIHKI